MHITRWSDAAISLCIIWMIIMASEHIFHILKLDHVRVCTLIDLMSTKHVVNVIGSPDGKGAGSAAFNSD